LKQARRQDFALRSFFLALVASDAFRSK
jgi:hypothetical protein